MAVIIRDAQTKDAAAIAAIYEPYVNDTPISFEETAPDAAEIARRMENIQAKYPYLVAEAHGSIEGYAYGGEYRSRHAYRHSTEVSIYTNAARSGIGRALYTELLQRLANQGYHTALAVLTLPNPNSVAFHEAMGFVKVGQIAAVGRKQDAWHDTGIWQLMLSDNNA